MSGFRELAANLAKLDGIPSRIAVEVAGKINESIATEFASGSDPYGNAWAPLLPSTIRRKGGDSRILIDEGSLASDTVAKPTSGAGIEITSLDYGGVHQAGTSLTKRAILPEGSELPDSWSTAIQDASSKAFAKAMK